jgi:large subunit ribosomal protein L28
MSDALGRCVQLRVSAKGVRTIEKRGGLDEFLMDASDHLLSANVIAIKRAIALKLSDQGKA